jgi:hypothetical protein
MGQPLGLGWGGVMKVGLLGALGHSITLASLGVVFIVGDSLLWERGKVSRRGAECQGKNVTITLNTYTLNHRYNTHMHTHSHELRYHPHTNAYVHTS